MKWVDRCLKSLRESSVPLNLVIIDNGSKDNTISYIKENYQDAHIIVNDKNKGFGQANNQGIEYAYNNGATHFFLLNQDAWIQKDSVSVLVETMDRYHLAVVSPIQLNGDGTMYDKSFCRAAVFNTQNVSLISDLTFGTIKDYYTVISVPAASWLISKDTIETIGGFDPLFFHYGEDSNYCQRLKFHKLTIAIAPRAFINHDREEKGNIELFNKLLMLRALFLEYANINLKPFLINKNTFKLHLRIVVNLLMGLLTFDGKRISNTWWTILQFYSHIRDIKTSRMNNVLIGANWLRISKNK